MTNRERAARLVYGDAYPADALARRLAQFDEDVSMGEKRALAMKGILAALDEKDAECERRVAEERERCAKVAEAEAQAWENAQLDLDARGAMSVAYRIRAVSPAPEPVATGEAKTAPPPSPRVPREMVERVMREAWVAHARWVNGYSNREENVEMASAATARVLTDGPHSHYPMDAVLAAIAAALGWTPGQGQGGNQ